MPAGCTGRAGPGTLAFQAWALRRFAPAVSLGDYVCRNVVGGSTISLHGLGRAFDIGGFHAPSPHGDEIFAWMVGHATAIGGSEIIWNRQIWTPGKGVHPYSGTNPHTDHVHIGIDQAHAFDAPLTAAQLDAINGGATIPPVGGVVTVGPSGPLGGAGITTPSLPDLSSITGLFHTLTDPNTYKRYGVVVLGVVLLLAGVAIILRDVAPTALEAL